jgi:hypothetical protein
VNENDSVSSLESVVEDDVSQPTVEPCSIFLEEESLKANPALKEKDLVSDFVAETIKSCFWLTLLRFMILRFANVDGFLNH